jgi:hypothetical protein
MKNRFVSTLLVVFLLSSFFLASCGPAMPPGVTREQQLAETGLFGKHTMKGVTIESTLSGEFSGGFFIFAAGVHGEISTTTNYIISWYPTPDQYIISEVPRELIVVHIVEGLAKPQIEFVFKESWLSLEPSPFEKDVKVDRQGNVFFTEGSKLNLNNFILVGNLDVVNVYLSPEDLLPPSQ